MNTVFYDGVTGKELKPEETLWLRASLNLVRDAATPAEFEEYKAELLASCLVEERPKP